MSCELLSYSVKNFEQVILKNIFFTNNNDEETTQMHLYLKSRQCCVK